MGRNGEAVARAAQPAVAADVLTLSRSDRGRIKSLLGIHVAVRQIAARR